MGEAIGWGINLQQTIRACGIGSAAAAALNAAAAPAEGRPIDANQYGKDEQLGRSTTA